MSQQVSVQIKRLPHGQGLALPTYQTEHAAGCDLHAAVESDVVISPGQIALIPSGFSVAIPHGYEIQIRPRSGLAVKHGVSMPNTPGTIDADYRGEVKVPLINLGGEPFTVTRGMRIAQMLIKPVYVIQWEEVVELPQTSRDTGGFGHTGH